MKYFLLAGLLLFSFALRAQSSDEQVIRALLDRQNKAMGVAPKAKK